MLEKNFLYRRMQNRDIFRTFSRTYSRQHHQRSFRNQNHNSTTDPLQNTQPHLLSSFRIVQQGRVYTANQNIRKDFRKGQTEPYHLKTEQLSQKNIPFSQTLNLNSINSKFSRRSSNQKESYLSSTLGKRKQSDSMLTDIHGRNRGEHFRLKACMKKQNQHYQGHQDDTDFSILELQKQNALKVCWIGGNKTKSTGIFKLHSNYDYKKMNPNKGRKVAAHVFSKYAGIISPQKMRNMTTNNQLE